MMRHEQTEKLNLLRWSSAGGTRFSNRPQSMGTDQTQGLRRSSPVAMQSIFRAAAALAQFNAERERERKRKSRWVRRLRLLAILFAKGDLLEIASVVTLV